MFINGDANYKIEKLLIHVKCCKNETKISSKEDCQQSLSPKC